MADLTDRGQIILIAAFALAVTFLALALVVNSAIFTENLDTRGETSGGTDALLYRHEVAENTANLTAAVNRNTTVGLVDELDRSLENLSRQGGFQNARQGRIVTVDLDEDSAVVLADLDNNDTSAYTNATGETDWTLATDTGAVRSAQFNVTNAPTTNESHAYYLFVNDTGSSDYWRMSVFKRNSITSDDYNVTVRNEVGRVSSCEPVASGGNFTINLTGGQVEGASPDCSDTLSDANRTFTGYTTKNITYREANNVTGNYSIQLENADLNVGNFNDTSPTAEARLEELAVTYTYESDRLRYNTTVPIAPGEIDG